MAKATPKIVTLRGMTELSDAQLARAIAGLFANAFPPVDFALTQMPRVQVAQAPKANK